MVNRQTTSTPNLSVNIAGIQMKNPVMTASGTFGFGVEYADLIDLNSIGAIVVKGICLHGARGNNPPRIVEVPGGLLNAIGLQNPGVDGFLNTHLPALRQYDTPVIVNIWGTKIEEYALVAEKLDGVEGVSGLELNISCPNLEEGGNAFGTNVHTAAKVVSTVRRVTSLPIIPKLPPNMPDVGLLAKVCEDSGADAISLINTFPAMVIDIETRRPILANKTGGLSGPAIHPIAVKLVWDVYKSVKIPIIGMGGITSAKEAIEFMIAGASAVAVGTATFMAPDTIQNTVDGLKDYLVRKNISDLHNLTGSIVTNS
ncbi:MAG: dihydroorotate dehydrogenase [Lentisphaerae bacterium]|nr:dihydroorotate dehydrogenase [Lentisphaerota bacterium]